MSTTKFQPKALITRKWHLIDANSQILGRLACNVARLLSGKAKVFFAHHVDGGDMVVITNAANIRITGNNKPTQKMDFRHSGYPGGDTMTPYGEFLRKKPERAIWLSIYGMLPKTRLRQRQMARLKIYKGAVHPHGAQFAPAKSAQPKPETAQA